MEVFHEKNILNLLQYQKKQKKIADKAHNSFLTVRFTNFPENEVLRLIQDYTLSCVFV